MASLSERSQSGPRVSIYLCVHLFFFFFNSLVAPVRSISRAVKGCVRYSLNRLEGSNVLQLDSSQGCSKGTESP